MNNDNYGTFHEYLEHDRFWHYLKRSKMWKNLLASKEGLIALILAALTEILIDIGVDRVSYLRQVIEFKVGFIVLALLSTGCLIMTAINFANITKQMNHQVVMQVYQAGKYSALMNLAFQFYYDAVLTGTGIILSILNGIAIPNLLYGGWLYYFAIFVNLYLFYYTLILSIMLIGTNLRCITLIHYQLTAISNQKEVKDHD